MRFVAQHKRFGRALGLLLATAAGSVGAATPSVSDALKLAPVQREIDYDRPTEAEVPKCTLEAEQVSGRTGWIVRSPNGQLLRRFLDTNNDNVVDQWSYYSAGLEVYRDIDQNYNGKADQYRWLNTAGTRWGLDPNEDGKIDSWKTISPEEVSAEVVRAIGDRDTTRFSRLLLTSDEMKTLGLASAQVDALTKKINEAPEKFRSFTSSARGASVQTTSNAKPKWVHFGGSLPGMVPAGTNGATKDIVVYENVVAMIQNGEKHDQVPIGTLVQVGQSWRLIDAPVRPADGQELVAAGGFFFPAPLSKTSEAGNDGEGGTDARLQKMMADLEKIDEQLRSATGAEASSRLNATRADLVEQIAAASSADDRGMWLRQLADTVSAAVQSGTYTGGVERLRALESKLTAGNADDELRAYIEFRLLAADYGAKINQPKADFVAIQKEWIENLKKFVEAHPRSADSAEAMLQVAIAQEFAGEEQDAKQWYTKIVSTFPQAPAAKKAEGARVRLDSVGKTIELSGNTVDGRALNLRAYKGKVVVVQYWSTTCEPCKADMAQLKELLAKYKKDGLEIVGVSLDGQKADLTAYLRSNRVPWPILFEEGGLDSRLANSMGILTLPTMLLIDKQGKVANRNIHAAELDKEVGTLVR